jgi:hypothetical protein
MKDYFYYHALLNEFVYTLVLQKLKKLEKNYNSQILRFPLVFQEICRGFQLSKQNAWKLLFILEKIGAIQIIPNQGIIILKESIN